MLFPFFLFRLINTVLAIEEVAWLYRLLKDVLLKQTFSTFPKGSFTGQNSVPNSLL